MPLLVVGSIAFDSIRTLHAQRDYVMGGSAIYSAFAASFFSPVRMMGIVGGDWPSDYMKLLQERQIDTRGIQIFPDQKTFHWKGRYFQDMNGRESLETDLNVYAQFDPIVPEVFRESPFVLLANAPPTIHLKVLSQLKDPQLIVADTMDLWIQTEHAQLMELLPRLHGLVLNDSEAKMITEASNTIQAGKQIQAMGPRFVIIKKGEHGALYFDAERISIMPAYPTEVIVDPTGAGDCFLGGMLGYVASRNCVDGETLRQAMAYGTVLASFNVEGFSLERLRAVDNRHIEERLLAFQRMIAF